MSQFKKQQEIEDALRNDLKIAQDHFREDKAAAGEFAHALKRFNEFIMAGRSPKKDENPGGEG